MSPKRVKTTAQIDAVDALILPGGESTTMVKLLHLFDVWDGLSIAIRQKPVWGICAGAILLASHIDNQDQDSFAALDITVRRNGYGRQLDSHMASYDGYPVSFIRAPVINHVGKDVETVWKNADHPVWVRQGQVMATTFHPEMTLDAPSPMHLYFKDLIA